MIQRNKKTEIVIGDKLVNENNINSKKKKKTKEPINEFVGGSKLVNENNIVIKIEEPVKKKRKRKPKLTPSTQLNQEQPKKISDIAKINYQETLNKYQAGTYPKFPMPNIATIKTDADLNKITNLMKLQMNETPLPVDTFSGTRTNIPPPTIPLTEMTTKIASPPTLPPPTLNAPVRPILPQAPVRPILPQAPVIIDENYKIFDRLFIYFLDILKKISNKEDTTEIDDRTLLYYKRNDEILTNIERNKFYKYVRTFLDRLNAPIEIKNFIYNNSFPKLYFQFRELSIREKDLSDDVNVKEDEKKRVDSTKNITKKDIEKEKKILEEEQNKLKEENKNKNIDEEKKKENEDEIKQIDELKNAPEIEIKEHIYEKNEINKVEKTFKLTENQKKQILQLGRDTATKRQTTETFSKEPISSGSTNMISNSQRVMSLPEIGAGAMKDDNTTRSGSNIYSPQPSQNTGGEDYLPPSYEEMLVDNEKDPTIIKLKKFVDSYWRLVDGEIKFIPIGIKYLVTGGKIQTIKQPNKTSLSRMGDIYFSNNGEKDYFNLKSERKTPSTGKNADMTYDELAKEFITDFLLLYPNYFETQITTPVKKLTAEEFYNQHYPKGVFDQLGSVDELLEYIKPFRETDKTLKGVTKSSGKARLSEIFKDLMRPNVAPSPDTTPELTEDEFYEKYYPNGVFTLIDNKPTKEELLKRIKKLNPETSMIIDNEIDILADAFKINHQEECLVGRRSADCIKLSDYYRYLNYLSTTNELIELKNEYIKATGDDIEFVDSSDSIKIKKIKESGYKPTITKNPEFFDWARRNRITPTTEPTAPSTEPTPTPTPAPSPTPTPDPIPDPTEPQDTSVEIALLTSDEYKSSISSLTVANDERKINAYFSGFKQWNADNGNFLTIPRDISTQDKLNMLIKYKNLYQYIDINEPERKTAKLTGQIINNNEVELCKIVCEQTYLIQSDRQENINQLFFDDDFSDEETSIYRDTTNNIIYFGSRGSITTEDWVQSDLSIVFGINTSTFSPRLTRAIQILNTVVRTWNPTTVIFCGHSLGNYLSCELFVYTLRSIPSISQPFSIGFNGGKSVMPATYQFNPYNPNFINSHVLCFTVIGDFLSMGQNVIPFGRVVNVRPSSLLLLPNHFLSVYDEFDFKPYRNFVNYGLGIANPDLIVQENTPASISKGDKVMPLEPTGASRYDESDNNTTYSTNKPYKAPIAGTIGAVIGGSIGAATSLGNPAVIAGTSALGFLAGETIQNAIDLPPLP